MATKEKVTCPNCDTKDQELVDGSEGKCNNCGLNLGAVYARYRHERAVQKLHSDNPVKDKKEESKWW